jgi:hypothetical protein
MFNLRFARNFVATAFLSIMILLLCATACHQKTPAAPAAETGGQPADTVSKEFFPVADYIQGEIRYVDSTPLAILKFNMQDGKTDSSFIRQGEFNRLAQEFLPPDLATDNFEKNYSEKSFLDETTGSYVFTYSPKNNGLALQRVDVLIAAGKKLDNIKSIYLEKSFSSGDTLVTKKMFWKARKSFLIVTTLRVPPKLAVVGQLRVVWDNTPSDPD